MSAPSIQNVVRLARRVREKCRTCQGDYRSLADGVRKVQSGLLDLEDTTPPEPSDAQELERLVQASSEVLEELSSLVDRYNALPLQSRRTWDRMHWDQGAGTNIEHRLLSLSVKLTSFYEGLNDSPPVRIERALAQLAEEVSNGRHETTTATSLSTATDPDDDSGWYQIVRDLGDFGVSEDLVNQYKDFIIDWILHAINDGLLTDEKIPVETYDKFTSDKQIPMLRSPVGLTSQQPSRSARSSIASTPLLQRNPPQVDYILPEVINQQSPPYLRINSPNRPSVSPPAPNTITRARPELSTLMTPPYQQDSINTEDPPSPMEEDVPAPESNILWNAQRISQHWARREWYQAQKNLNDQIASVERGEYVDVSGFLQQPDVRILKHLRAVSFSLAGDFITAREAFESVLSGVYMEIMYLDEGDIAAARWLGETCILSNQAQNACLAWALAYFGMQQERNPPIPGAQLLRMREDLRMLQLRTNGLNALKSSFVNHNRDNSSILPNMPGTNKFTVVTIALDALAASVPTSQAAYIPPRLSQNLNIGEGFLIQPLVSQTSWPLPQDPFFRQESSIGLLRELSGSRQTLALHALPSASLGKSSSLIYATKKSVEWLSEAVRLALNTYAIEWKIRPTDYLLRLSQTQGRIAYYDCFTIRFRKLRFGKGFGFKLSESVYCTRYFDTSSSFAEPGEDLPVVTAISEVARMEQVRLALADRLKDFVIHAEKEDEAGNWPPKALYFPPTGPAEMDANERLPPELGASTIGRGHPELGGEGVRRKPIPSTALPSYEIFEMPG